jgi:hypothetical protein
MIEATHVERPQLGVDAVMFDMTRYAHIGGVAVHALLLGDALRDGLMAGEALRWRHLLAGGVTFQAVGDPFERRMSARQSSWRDQRAKLRRCGPRCPKAEKHGGHYNHPPASDRESGIHRHSPLQKQARISKVERDGYMYADDEEHPEHQRPMEDMPRLEQLVRPLEVKGTPGKGCSLCGEGDAIAQRVGVDSSRT